jgi:hypothetical protein
MSKQNPEAKRQLFRGLSSKKNTLDTAAHNLLTRTLKKQSDKYKPHSKGSAEDGDSERFVIHKSTSPEDYKVFSSQHPLRESKLQAFGQSEQAFEELFNRNGFLEDSGSEDEEPDLSAFVTPSEVIDDDILISVPGYSKEEITASKRLNINDRKNVRLSRVTDLERAFANNEFLKTFSPRKLDMYNDINTEYVLSVMGAEQKKNNNNNKNKNKNDKRKKHHFPRVRTEEELQNPEVQELEHEDLRRAVSLLGQTAWLYEKQ